MVMRNRSDGSDATHWWDDLPPKVQRRVTQPLAPPARSARPAEEPPQPFTRLELVRDLWRLAALFVLVALGITLYLLLAVTFVTG